MRSPTIAALLVNAAWLAHGQTFDPKMPASVPAVSGAVTEQATLRYIDVKTGTGAPALPGQQYTVHYTGWLRDGTQFDSSAGKDPLKFVQGRREVIAGFDVGFEGMKVGGKRRIFIPYQLAYGEQQRGKITPKSELIFDIELVEVKEASPQPAAAADLLLPFSEMQDHVMALAKAIPEEKYGWQPAPGVRSIREVLLHIAYGNQLMLNIANNAPPMDVLKKQMEENYKGVTAVVSRDKVLQLLTESFTAVRTTLETARAAALNRSVDFFGTAATRRGVLASIDTHIAELEGQLIAYARMNGIVPPWSQPAR
jgi:uncharacterized damage-inducible protein DinB